MPSGSQQFRLSSYYLSDLPHAHISHFRRPFFYNELKLKLLLSLAISKVEYFHGSGQYNTNIYLLSTLDNFKCTTPAKLILLYNLMILFLLCETLLMVTMVTNMVVLQLIRTSNRARLIKEALLLVEELLFWFLGSVWGADGFSLPG